MACTVAIIPHAEPTSILLAEPGAAGVSFRAYCQSLACDPGALECLTLSVSESFNDSEYPYSYDWDCAVQTAWKYLAGGNMEMHEYLDRYSTPLLPWQKTVYRWCLANPHRKLHIARKSILYRVDAMTSAGPVTFSLRQPRRKLSATFLSNDGMRKLLTEQIHYGS